MLLLVAVAVFAGALAQSVSGIGFSLVTVPILVAALGTHEGIRLCLVLSVLVNVLLLVRHHAAVDRRGALLLLVPAALATPVFAVALRALPDRPARAATGLVILLAAALLGFGVRLRAARGTAGAVCVALVAALTNVLAGVGGPPLALWAANTGWSAQRTLATLQAVFLGLNLVTITSLGLPHAGIRLVVTGVLALSLGLLVGAPLALKVPERAARRATLALAAAGGLAVLGRALSP